MTARLLIPKSVCAGATLLALTAAVFGQSSVTNSGGEFLIAGSQPGDQVWPSVSLSPTGGVVAWQDNHVDHRGGGVAWGILGQGFTAAAKNRVNHAVTGLQLRPQAAVLPNGDTFFVWQGSVTSGGRYHIYGRYAHNAAKGAKGLGTNFYGPDIQINTFTEDQQVDPVVTVLPDGSVVVAWSSYGQDGSGWGVYARKLAPDRKPAAVGTGKSAAKQFQVNQYTPNNQRNPAIATLAGGNFVVAWASEGERAPGATDVYARIFNAGGLPAGDEILIDSASNNPCSSPALAPLGDGGFTVVWSEQDVTNRPNGWDIYGRTFSANGTPETNDFLINTYRYGDQYSPKIAAGPSGSLVVWTSLGEDGSREGVYGRFLAGGTQPVGSEFIVNTTTVSQQMHPAVAWNGVDHFLVVWTGFNGATGFDLYGQAYVLTSTP